MKASALNAAVIRTAVHKGLADFKKNPERAARNLTDLGQMFSKGRHQKNFFDTAVSELKNKKSPYYGLVKGIVDDTDPDLLLTFGMNLGYYALSYGADAIRKVEDNGKYNVPWTLLFHFEEKGALSADDVSDIIRQGKELGINCSFFFLRDESLLDTFLKIAASEKDYAFFLFVEPAYLSESICDRILSCKNTAVFINLDGENKDAQHAVSMLRERNCLLGGYTCFLPDASGIADYLKEVHAKFHIPFLFFLSEKAEDISDDFVRSTHDYRLNMKSPIVPLLLLNDITYIDRSISSEACIFSADQNGDTIVANMEAGAVITGESVKKNALQEILQKLLPKRRQTTNTA